MPLESPDATPKVPANIAFFTGAYLAPAIVAAIWTRNGEFVFYSVVMAIQAVLVVVTHRHCAFTQPVLWGLSLWGLAHMIGGLVPVPESWPINGPIRVVYRRVIITKSFTKEQQLTE